MEWIFLSIAIITMGAVMIVDRYCEYKEKQVESEDKQC